MVASLMGIGLVLAGPAAPAQEAARPGAPPLGSDPQPARVLHFTKPANAPLQSGNQAGAPQSVAAPRDSALRPVALQVPPRIADESQEYEVELELEPPGPLKLFRLESEKAWQERRRQKARDGTRPGAAPERIIFPDEPVISRQPYAGRSFPPANLSVEPVYVCYQRLLFEQRNSERYGWDLGPIQPLLSATGFYWDLVTLPYHVGTDPCRQYECSAGYCLPGEPLPLLLYPPELSLSGLVAEAGIVTALFAIFP